MHALRLMLPLWFLVLVTHSQTLLAQAAREPVQNDVVAKIKEEGTERSRVMQTVSFLTDVHGPRLTGSPLTRQAGEWAIKQLTEWGLENASLEPWGPFGRGWTLEEFTARMVSPNFSPLIGFPKAWSPSTPKAVRGQPIYLEAQTEKELDQYRGRLNKAIVMLSAPREVKALFDPPARRQTDETLLTLSNSSGSYLGFQPVGSSRPSESSRTAASGSSPASPPSGSGRFGGTPEQRAAFQLQSRKLQLAYEEGAAVILEAGRGDGGTVFVGSASLGSSRSGGSSSGTSARRPSVWSTDAPHIIPQVVLAVEHYNRIVRMLQKDVPVELEIDIASRYHDQDLMSFNVIAEIPGGDLRNEVVMLGAHFDSWHSGTGATDNAVGCAVVMEAVRILKAIGAKPRRTIRLALWTGEEQGLLGSKAYVAEHFGRAITPTRPERSAESNGGQDSQPPVGERPAEPSGGDNPPSPNASNRSSNAQPSRERPPTRYELKPGHESFSAYFNLDNGTGKIRGIFLQNNEAVRPIFRAWLAPYSDQGAATISLSNTGGTDHLSFDSIGLPGFQFIQDPLEYDSRTHHSSMDVYERIQEEDVKQASIIMASFVYHAAMRDEKLPRKPLVGEIIPPGSGP